jgi:hypothetical protein
VFPRSSPCGAKFGDLLGADDLPHGSNDLPHGSNDLTRGANPLPHGSNGYTP